jgi:hypothetical protein
MVSKEDLEKFILKMNSITKKFPDITDKFKLENDKEFQKSLGKVGTLGGLLRFSLDLYEKILDKSNNEETCYSLILTTAISVAVQIIKEADEISIDEKSNEEIIKNMIKIYSFKETDKEKYKEWNGKPSDHPVIVEFKEKMLQLLIENNLESEYPAFLLDFDTRYYNEIKKNPKIIDCLSEITPIDIGLNKQDNYVPMSKDLPTIIDTFYRKPLAKLIANTLLKINNENLNGLSDGPFLINIHGPWGSGKTTLANFVFEELKSKRNPKWIITKFNAWEYQRLNAPPWWLLMDIIFRDCCNNISRYSSIKLKLWEYSWRLMNGNSNIFWGSLIFFIFLIMTRSLA